MATTPKNWKYDGWAARDWQAVEDYSRDLVNVASDLDKAVGEGGGWCAPDDLLAIASRTEIITKRLRELAHGYYA